MPEAAWKCPAKPRHFKNYKLSKSCQFCKKSRRYRTANASVVHDHLLLPPGAPPPFRSSHLSEAATSVSFTTSFDEWEKMERIGGGRFGIVCIARNRATTELCAVKEMFDTDDLQVAKSLDQEIQVLSKLKHPNIVKYYGSKIVGNQVSLYMEYVQPGSMKKYISGQGALEEPLVRHFTAQILSGLVYLHSQRIVHRDIKADNLLIYSNNNVKLADFGLAKHLDLSVGHHSEMETPHWTAPELFKSKKYNSSAQALSVDIWSLGCTVIEMLTGKLPWHGLEPAQVIYKVCKHKQNPPVPETLSSEGKDFLVCCFTRSPAKRPSSEALSEHSFVKNQL